MTRKNLGFKLNLTHNFLGDFKMAESEVKGEVKKVDSKAAADALKAKIEAASAAVAKAKEERAKEKRELVELERQVALAEKAEKVAKLAAAKKK